VRVATDGGEVGVAEVGGDEARIAGLLAEPGRGGVPECVRGRALLEPGAFGGAADDQAKDRAL
jgi:hypothetical protein